MLHGLHIYAKAYDMAKATMCDNSQSDHVLPHWKCVLRFCAQYPRTNIPGQETDDKHPNPSPSIHFSNLSSDCTLYKTWQASVIRQEKLSRVSTGYCFSKINKNIH